MTVECLGVSGGRFALNGQEYAGGTCVTGLSAGSVCRVVFLPVEGHTTPAAQEVTVPFGGNIGVAGTYGEIPQEPEPLVACGLLDRDGAVYVASGNPHVAGCADGGYYKSGDKLYLCTEAGGEKTFSEVSPAAVAGVDVPGGRFQTTADAVAGDYYRVASTGKTYRWGGGSTRLREVPRTDGHHADLSCSAGYDADATFVPRAHDADLAPAGAQAATDAYPQTGEWLSADQSDTGSLDDGEIYYFSNPSWTGNEGAGHYRAGYIAEEAYDASGLDTAYGRWTAWTAGQEGEPSDLEDGAVYYFANPSWTGNSGAGYYLAKLNSGNTWSLLPNAVPWTLEPVTDGAKWYASASRTNGVALEAGRVYHFSNPSWTGNSGAGYYRAGFTASTRLWKFASVTGPKWFGNAEGHVDGNLSDGEVIHFSNPSWRGNKGAGYYRAELEPEEAVNASTEAGKLLDGEGEEAGDLVDGRVYWFNSLIDGERDDVGGYFRAVWDEDEDSWSLVPIARTDRGIAEAHDADPEEGKLLDGEGNESGDLEDGRVYRFSHLFEGTEEETEGLFRAVWDEDEGWSFVPDAGPCVSFVPVTGPKWYSGASAVGGCLAPPEFGAVL